MSMSVTKNMSVTKKLILGGTAGAIAMFGALATASAKGGHHHHHHGFFRYGPAVVVTSGYNGSCDYYYWRWKRTGSSYWRSKYFACVA